MLAVFVSSNCGISDPLIELRIFAHRGFAADNIVLVPASACFVPLFFFASVYAQVVLGDNAGKTGLYILVIFIGFAGGEPARRADPRPPRRPPAAVAGLGARRGRDSASGRSTCTSRLGSQWSGSCWPAPGLGLALTPVSTDAVNRAPRGSYGEVTGVTQTVRYFASSLGLAMLGSILIDENRRDITHSLTRQGVPKSIASHVA